MSVLIYLGYFWVCAVFTIVYIQREANREYLASWDGDACAPSFFYYTGFILFLSWWYWPVMIVNFIKELAIKNEKEIDKIRNS
jgi:hypothetical protein